MDANRDRDRATKKDGENKGENRGNLLVKEDDTVGLDRS